jgi:hypothetical protein
MPMPSRTRRYSGSDRPACRMNQTGVRAGRCPVFAAQQARTNGEAAARAVLSRSDVGVLASAVVTASSSHPFAQARTNR